MQIGSWEDSEPIEAAVVTELTAVEAAAQPKVPRPASREGKALAMLTRQPVGMSLAEWTEGAPREVCRAEAEAKERDKARQCVDRLVKREPPCIALSGDTVTARGAP